MFLLKKFPILNTNIPSLFIRSSQCEPTPKRVFSSASIGHTSTSNRSLSKMCMQVNYEGLLLYNYKYP